MTVQNETTARQVWESCLFSPEQEADFAINYLSPALQFNNLDVKILIHDHNKDNVFERATKIFNIDTNNVISGIGIHWYTGDYFDNIVKCRDAFKNKLVFHTEGCVGFSDYRIEDEIKNAEMYAHDIIGDLNAGVTAYIDWNILLDNNGGPNHKNNYCNAPSMLKDGSYYNNLCYYYIQHFAKYIQPNSSLVKLDNTSNIEATCFKNDNNTTTFVLLNKNNTNETVTIKINNSTVNLRIKKNSIITVVI
jgi:glucosylceramidase